MVLWNMLQKFILKGEGRHTYLDLLCLEQFKHIGQLLFIGQFGLGSERGEGVHFPSISSAGRNIVVSRALVVAEGGGGGVRRGARVIIQELVDDVVD